MRDAPRETDPARVEAAVGASRSVLGAARELARRSSRFSWASWGFLYAAWGGAVTLTLLIALFPAAGPPSSGGGVAGPALPPLGYVPLVFAPAILLLLWALHELFTGRAAARAAIRGNPPGAPPSGDRDDPPGWTQQVVDAQKLLTAAKLETDWSFVPLGIGLLGCDVLVGTTLLTLVGGPAPLNPYLPIGIGAAVLCVALFLLYRVAQQWIGEFQRHLDRQVRELSELEAEFLWRFAGPTA